LPRGSIVPSANPVEPQSAILNFLIRVCRIGEDGRRKPATIASGLLFRSRIPPPSPIASEKPDSTKPKSSIESQGWHARSPGLEVLNCVRAKTDFVSRFKVSRAVQICLQKYLSFVFSEDMK
jgi:hypothetical protein